MGNLRQGVFNSSLDEGTPPKIHALRGRSTPDTPAGNQLSEHLGHFSNNKDRMRYVKLRNAGLPVGSGVTESAAKTVIGQRAKRSGKRWRERGLRNALTLRALHQSGRLPKFWTQLSRCYVANVREAA